MDRWQPPPGWDDEEETARKLGKKASSLKRWRMLTKKRGVQVGPRWSFAGIGRTPIYSHEAQAEFLESNQPKPPRKPHPRSRATTTVTEINP
jgi:hypothetical protein